MLTTTRKTIQRSTNLRDSYNNFPYKDEIDYKTYRAIISAYHLTLLDSIIEEGAVYKLPYDLGIIGCFQRTTFGRGIFDYKLYNQEGIYRYTKNKHTEGRVVRFVWDNMYFRGIESRFKNFYSWKPPRDVKRKLASLLKSDTSITIYNHLNE